MMVDDAAIYEIVGQQAKVDPSGLTPETRFEDLDLQSLDIVELVFSLEDKFDIEIPYSPNQQNAAGVSFQTIGDVIAAVGQLVAEQHPDSP